MPKHRCEVGFTQAEARDIRSTITWQKSAHYKGDPLRFSGSPLMLKLQHTSGPLLSSRVFFLPFLLFCCLSYFIQVSFVSPFFPLSASGPSMLCAYTEKWLAPGCQHKACNFKIRDRMCRVLLAILP